MMMLNLKKLSRVKIPLLILAFGFLSLTACQSDFTKLVKAEAATGEKYTDLIFNIKMGQTQKDFYTQCWELNKKGLISQGPGNQSVLYVIDSTSTFFPSDNKIDMLFYGVFDDKKNIVGMKMKFSYAAWAPWNKDLQSDDLMNQLSSDLLAPYPGNNFIDFDTKDEAHPAKVKIDGDRQIHMFILDSRYVELRIENTLLKYNL